MSGVDVRDLMKEELRAGTFPADSRADFRLHIAPEVRRGIEQHAKAGATVEICGVLVGHWGRDENGPFATVTDYIRCDNASSKVAEVTFTHESWAQINKEMDSKYSDKRIVGWYHSHPDFGIFLSERDCFIHEHFFSGPGQLAFVVDPVRDLEGVFAWRNGKPTLLSHYWVGNDIRGLEASERSGASVSTMKAAQTDARPSSPSTSLFDTSWTGVAATALALLTLFLLGYMYGTRRTDWEQRMIMAGAVAHFMDTKMIRQGLHEDVSGVQSRLTAAANEFQKLPEPATKLSKQEIEKAAKGRKFISESLALCQAALTRIEQRYALSDVERSIVAQIGALKQAELRKQLDATTQPTEKRDVRAVTGSAAREGQQPKNEAAGAANTKPGNLQAAPSEKPTAPPAK
jgi:proteasome lid subunit RPN8/RPN11